MRNSVPLLLILCFFLASARLAYAFDSLLPGKIDQTVQRLAGKYRGIKLGVAVADAGSGKEIYSRKADSQMIPASVLKIVTSKAALNILGAEYRFPTEVFWDGTEETEGNLYVRGYGDPSLVEENLWQLALLLRDKGIVQIKNLVIDDSLFVEPPAATGPRAYQAALSATSINNNCYRLRVSPGTKGGGPAHVGVTPGGLFDLSQRVKTLNKRGKSVRIVQSPLSSSFNPKAPLSRVGNFYDLGRKKIKLSIQGYIGLSQEIEEIYRSVPNPARYFASVFEYVLKSVGVNVSGLLLRGETPSAARLVHVYKSKPLKEILRDLNHYSSNFIAEQICYVLGQDSLGYFRHDLGLERLTSVLEQLGYDSGQFKIADASGLNPNSRLTAEQLLKVLVALNQDFSISSDFISSLSRYNNSGTLKMRRLITELSGVAATGKLYLEEKRRAEGVWGKTGTLTGVSSLAGYLETRSEERLAYVILVNGKVDKNTAIRIENEIVKSMIGVVGRK